MLKLDQRHGRLSCSKGTDGIRARIRAFSEGGSFKYKVSKITTKYLKDITLQASPGPLGGVPIILPGFHFTQMREMAMKQRLTPALL
ncbi:hypothetical protein KIN20_037058 [Parelaphostrongylus tenuis]|uniref:Uncharacterized protein n=1 Tax=Parelaphostrongylus tenuis TaxID=148309 RepID=A0AAD5WM53_PARTN|nr:hypothetical protein KIN20_037058 [Parelaphostrongylus tenuis]